MSEETRMGKEAAKLRFKEYGSIVDAIENVVDKSLRSRGDIRRMRDAYLRGMEEQHNRAEK